MASQKVIVFGGNGFIGSHFVDQLVAQNHEVTVFDRFSPGRRNNLEQQEGKFRKITGDFSNQDAVCEALHGQQIACHLIWYSTPISSWSFPMDDIMKNMGTSLQFLDACVKQGVRKAVFLSSGGTVYGNATERASEDTVPCPFSPYGINKLAVEHFFHHYTVKFGLAADVYRVANAYGPRQPLTGVQGVIAVWMGRILNGETFDVYADENNVRDYVYVEDIAQLMSHSLTSMDASDTFNIGTGTGVSLLTLLELFKKIIDVPINYRLHPPRPSDVKSSILDSDKILKLFPGFTFKQLEQMIAHTWEQAKKAHATAPTNSNS